jgi:hypothetical protein
VRLAADRVELAADEARLAADRVHLAVADRHMAADGWQIAPDRVQTAAARRDSAVERPPPVAADRPSGVVPERVGTDRVPLRTVAAITDWFSRVETLIGLVIRCEMPSFVSSVRFCHSEMSFGVFYRS